MLFKVHYYYHYSLSTNHRHKPGIVQIWPKWQKTLRQEQGWQELGGWRWQGARLRQVLGYKHCSRQT